MKKITIQSLLLAAVGGGFVFCAQAQAPVAWPAKNIQMVVPWAAGGSVDTIGRAVAISISAVPGATKRREF